MKMMSGSPCETQIRKLDGPKGGRIVELQLAYGEDLSQGLLKVSF